MKPITLLGHTMTYAGHTSMSLACVGTYWFAYSTSGRKWHLVDAVSPPSHDLKISCSTVAVIGR